MSDPADPSDPTTPLSVDTFLEGSYQAPFFTDAWPGPHPASPFASPPAVVTFGPFEPGDAIAITTTVPAGGGTVRVVLNQRGVLDVDLAVDETAASLGGLTVGAGMTLAFSMDLSARLLPDTYFYRVVQTMVGGSNDGTQVRLGNGSFDVVSPTD